MRQDCLTVLSVVAVLSYLCLVKGTEGSDILRRFIYGDAHHSTGCLHGCLHGLCVTHLDTAQCRCDHGWTGSRCDVHIDCHHTCLHGSCSSLSGHCRCHDGWTGSACDEPVDFGTCRHNSDCHTLIRCDLNTRAICYFGQMCACVPIHADRRMRFVYSGGNGYGVVQNGGGGSQCGPYYCTHGSCQYTKMNGVETHSCTCYPGWHGEQCDQPVQSSGQLDPCNNHCGKHGTCTMHHSQQGRDYWSCKCDNGWHGGHCGYQNIVPTTTTTTTTTTTSKPDTMMVQNNHNDQVCNYHGYWTHSGCHCRDHWTGDKCQHPPGSGQQDHCHNNCGEHGTCTRHQSHHGNVYWSCKCDSGWHEEFCTVKYIVTHTTHCHNTYCVNGDCTYFEDTNGHQWHHRCKCHHGWDGDHCDNKITTSSQSPSTTTSTTSPTTTTIKTTTATPTTTTKQTTLPPASATSPALPTLSVVHISTTNTPHQTTAITVSTCNHVDTLSAIAQQTSVSNQNAIECSPGVHTSHEALVLTDCSVSQSSALWKQGTNVMTACSSNAIPNYTPIAAFDHSQYSSIGSLSGIFLGCTSDGFKMVVQTCGQTPYIAELHLGGSNTQNPNMYFTIS
ncbi:tenascin-like isoform X3 [Ruditapes philippinarum]|uniref:tenascin-like isoform X3 n=1 Tax=Ruditapes philippinarum TaxID=129788 RepID=UPI00295B6152|nr:tenascin-like isoform X3 [Ruditapes philippinarum]